MCLIHTVTPAVSLALLSLSLSFALTLSHALSLSRSLILSRARALSLSLFIPLSITLLSVSPLPPSLDGTGVFV